MSVRILTGDCREVLAGLPAESVHCIVTSPPYWGLRAYHGDPGMIGLEATFDEHLANLVDVFREVRRVLRPDGTLWLNYGDAYASQGGAGNHAGASAQVGSTKAAVQGRCREPAGFKPKDLMMMPARVALALQADGWWLRSEIVWHKPNPMPESVTDRPTSAHEKLYLLSKSARYFYDAEAVRTPMSESTVTRFGTDPAACWKPQTFVGESGRTGGRNRDENIRRDGPVQGGANLRNVWSIATHSFSQAHFATFPPALVEPCIRAGTSEHGCCAQCGAPWKRETTETTEATGGSKGKAWLDHTHDADRGGLKTASSRGYERGHTTGWSPSCACGADIKPCVVMDPFGGAGTVGLVADRLQRDAILIEISDEYAAMARKRIEGECPLFAEVA